MQDLLVLIVTDTRSLLEEIAWTVWVETSVLNFMNSALEAPLLNLETLIVA